jgi:hypothetical protein
LPEQKDSVKEMLAAFSDLCEEELAAHDYTLSHKYR